MAPSLAEWLDPRLAARHDVRVGVEFPAERIEGLMSVSAKHNHQISWSGSTNELTPNPAIKVLNTGEVHLSADTSLLPSATLYQWTDDAPPFLDKVRLANSTTLSAITFFHREPGRQRCGAWHDARAGVSASGL